MNSNDGILAEPGRQKESDLAELQALREEVEKLTKKRKPWFLRLASAGKRSFQSYLEKAFPTGEADKKAMAEYPMFVQSIAERRSLRWWVVGVGIVVMGVYGVLLADPMWI